jgi:hypothetical protein
MSPADAQSYNRDFNRDRNFNQTGTYYGGTNFNSGTNFNNGRWGNGGSQINSTQVQLQARINMGVRNGRLNQREAARLQTKLAQISQIEARMRATGNRLTFSERNRLNNQLASLSRDITKELNDFDRRRIGYWTNRNFR